ncbi:MAG: transposase [Thermoguttaceae bacterium]
MQEKTKDNKMIPFLQQQKGIGFITAITLYAEVGDFTRFKTGKQFANFCGMTPRNDSSAGKDKTGGLIGERNRDLRCVLIEAGHRLVRYDKHYDQMFHHLGSQKKKYNVAVAAVINRWLRKLFYQGRDFQMQLLEQDVKSIAT